jgi:hypothetical protein
MSVSGFYVGKICLYTEETTVTIMWQTLLGAAALCQRGRPPVAMMLYYLYADPLPVQVIRRHRIRPRPQRGQGWRKGGSHETRKPAECRLSGPPSNQNPIAPKIFRQFGFSSGKIWPYNLSSGIFLDFPTFKPEKTWPEKFHTNFFCDFQLSTGKFSGF